MNVTPTHHRMLVAVRDRDVEWREDIGLSGGFATVHQGRFPPGHDLVALYELNRSGLIEVDRPGGRVHLTATGASALGVSDDQAHRKVS
ncbi:hypothetical protein [Actinokineospora xionganensis]|uniref:Uncharacterized protein n=1 Tax=Actinokineospora xionganensis TaxID=2684470 RepID=A0ABR7L5P8_9PSEU|nr:hypothetical protein [Actinokineospora xionganensis]MBC6448005.1 hypothetical protein [Actinokineospora xionganensis]